MELVLGVHGSRWHGSSGAAVSVLCTPSDGSSTCRPTCPSPQPVKCGLHLFRISNADLVNTARRNLALQCGAGRQGLGDGRSGPLRLEFD